MVDSLKLTINQEPANFAHIHRALLTGLLSFIAQKVNDLDSQGKVIKAYLGEPDWAELHQLIATELKQ